MGEFVASKFAGGQLLDPDGHLIIFKLFQARAVSSEVHHRPNAIVLAAFQQLPSDMFMV
jgi:hypothetical protein